MYSLSFLYLIYFIKCFSKVKLLSVGIFLSVRVLELLCSVFYISVVFLLKFVLVKSVTLKNPTLSNLT